MTPRWNLHDGLVTVDAAQPLDLLVQEALGQGMHLGMARLPHATVQDALHAADPVVAHRLVRATVHGRAGDLGGPMSPRAAAGPDLACFAVGVGSVAYAVTLRADRAASWACEPDLPVAQALLLGRSLALRGCTLVELRGAARGSGRAVLWAALPRPSLVSLLPPSLPPAPARVSNLLGWRVTWADAPALWRALDADGDAPGSLLLHALNHDFAALRLVHEGAAGVPAGLPARLAARHLGPPSHPHPKLLLALSLRSHAPRFHAAG